MPKVFSITSLPGGVGRSYVTVALADFLSGAMKKKVLVIDLGAGGSATAMLIAQDRQHEGSEEHTAVRLIRDQPEPEAARFDFNATVQHSVSNVRQAPTIDHLRFDGSSAQPTAESNPSDSANSTDLLRRAVKSYLEDYDVVLVDCPASIGILTRNALRISDGYIIPRNSHFNLLTGI